MRKFISKVVLFIIILLCVVFLYEKALALRPNEFSYKKEYIEKNHDKIKILIMGHSQLEQGLIPSLIGDSIFNLAIEGRSNYYDSELLKRYLPVLHNIKCVIWPLSYKFQYSKGQNVTISDIFNGRNGMGNTYRNMYYKYMDIGCGKWSFIFWPETFNSKYEFAKRFFTSDLKTLTRCDSLGFHSNGPHNLANMNQTLPTEYNYDDESVKEKLKGGMYNINNIAQLCKDKGIRLIVITPPAYKNYQSKLTKRGLLELSNVVSSMKKIYPEIEYKNYLFDNRFLIEDFYNSSHLSEIGAIKFTKVVKNDFSLN